MHQHAAVCCVLLSSGSAISCYFHSQTICFNVFQQLKLTHQRGVTDVVPLSKSSTIFGGQHADHVG